MQNNRAVFYNDYYILAVHAFKISTLFARACSDDRLSQICTFLAVVNSSLTLLILGMNFCFKGFLMSRKQFYGFSTNVSLTVLYVFDFKKLFYLQFYKKTLDTSRNIRVKIPILISIVIAEKARRVTCHFAPFKRFDHLIVEAGLTGLFGDFTVDVLFQIGQACFFRFV